MDMLNDWRDEAVRTSDTTYVGLDGNEYEKSLAGTCLGDCHSNKDEFCDRCHEYVGAEPYCWDCHGAPRRRHCDGSRLTEPGSEGGWLAVATLRVSGYGTQVHADQRFARRTELVWSSVAVRLPCGRSRACWNTTPQSPSLRRKSTRSWSITPSADGSPWRNASTGHPRPPLMASSSLPPTTPR